LTCAEKYPSESLGITPLQGEPHDHHSAPAFSPASPLPPRPRPPSRSSPQGELNLYSSRHYDTDEALYSDFEELTGITVNRIEGNDDELIARIEAEGANSPADVFITVDTVRLVRAKAELGLLQPVESAVLEARVPAYLQDDDNQLVRLLAARAHPLLRQDRGANPPQTYADLAKPEFKGQVCMRSATNVYSQTLLASVIAQRGRGGSRPGPGLLDNLARAPQGGDTDQIRGSPRANATSRSRTPTTSPARCGRATTR
jgi:iron(III) transport system substrate-binding protein